MSKAQNQRIQWQKVNKDGETGVFEKKFAQKQIYHLYNFMSQEVTTTLGVNAHPTLPIAAHFFEAVWQIPPCVLR